MSNQKKQISSSVNDKISKAVNDVANTNGRSFSQMVEIILGRDKEVIKALTKYKK